MKVIIKECNKIEGVVKISGSKNSALPLLALCLLTNKKLKFTNVPMITDIYNMLDLLKELGVKIHVDKDSNEVVLQSRKIKKELSSIKAKTIRASYYLYPGMIKHHRKVKIVKPGGCNFTNRPINYHLSFLRASKVKVFEDEYYLLFKRKRLVPTNICFKTPSVGATINAIVHSVLIKGKTTISSQPIEPEIKEVITCLLKMGANIKVEKNQIVVVGVKKLKGISYEVMPDRIELGSYLLLASSTNSNIFITNIKKSSFSYLEPYLNQLHINYIYNKEELQIRQTTKIKGSNINIYPYPSFPTDLQPILCSALLSAEGQSIVKDNVYPNRLSHVKEIQKLNGKINVINNNIYINHSVLKGTNVYAHDLRCGFALIICAILSKGETIIDNFEVIFRGYENIVEKLKAIGIQIDENYLK